MPEAQLAKLPEHAREIWEEVYKDCKARGDSKQRAARKAWAAVKRSYHQNDDGDWVANASAFAEEDAAFLSCQAEELLASVGDSAKWSRILPVGNTWRHPTYGPITLTLADVEEMVANFKAGVFGERIPVDAPDHRDAHIGAYGWVVDMEARRDGLYARIEWTPMGKQAIEEGRFRYPSVEGIFKPKPATLPTGERIANAIRSVSPTNHPFFRELTSTPLQASGSSEYTEGELTLFDEALQATDEEDARDKLEQAREAQSGNDGSELQADGHRAKADDHSGLPDGSKPEEGDVDKMLAAEPTSDEGVKATMPETDEKQTEALQAEALQAMEAQKLEAERKLEEALEAARSEHEEKEQLQARLEAFERDTAQAQLKDEIAAWKFTAPVFDGEGQTLGDGHQVLSPAHQELAAEILTNLPPETAEKFRAAMSSGGWQMVWIDELGVLKAGTESRKQDEQELEKLPADTQAEIRAYAAANPGVALLAARDHVLRAKFSK